MSVVDSPIVSAAALKGPARIADLGCGGGGTTRALASHAPTGSVVHGYDISPALVEAARARSNASLTFTELDVATAPPPGEPYDRLVSRFGTMFYPDPPAAFANLRRWLVPGGRFVFAVWGPPKDNPWMLTVRDVIAAHAHVPDADPTGPGPFRYADAKTLLALLAGARFESLEVEDWRSTVPIGGGLSAADAASFAISAFSIGEAVVGDEVYRVTHLDLTDRFSEHEVDGVVRLGARIHLVTGTRS